MIEGHSPSAVPHVTAGELLRRRRRDLGHTQSVAAAGLGVNQATVSKWERGERIGWDHAGDVAHYLSVPPVVVLALNL